MNRFIALLLLAIPTTASAANSSITEYTIPLCNLSPCIVENDRGGVRQDYLALAARMVRTREQVRIKGSCLSACTILADQARPFVCIYRGSTFSFHQATIIDGKNTGKRFSVEYSRDIAAWLAAHGGQPTTGTLKMSYQDAKAFWPTC
jgi:hypothetical protein